MTKKRPPFIINCQDVQEPDDATYPGSDELLSIGSPVGRLSGLTRIGVHIETLPAGRRTSWPHAERDEEEFVFVLDGTPDIWLDGELHRVAPGDFIGFPAGTGIAHTVINNTDTDVRLLVGGESIKDAGIHYPLHPQRNQEMGDRWWADNPTQIRGDHDGKPTVKDVL